MKKLRFLLIGVLLFATGCSTMTATEKEQKRSEIDAMAKKAVAGLIEKDAAVQTEMDASLAYAVANMKVTKVPIFGAGGGEGVLVNKKTQQRIYFTVSRLDIGGGWGARSYKVLLIINEPEVLKRLEGGAWEFQAGVEASAGTAAAEGAAGTSNEGFTMHVLSDGGASATATARVLRIKVNSTLTED
jgi:hypothetical protein